MEIRYGIMMIAALLGLAVVYNLLAPIVFAVLVAFLAMPFYRGLKWGIKSRTASAFIITALVFGFIIAPFVFVIKSILQNTAGISVMAQSGLAEITAPAGEYGAHIISQFGALAWQKSLAMASGLVLATPLFFVQFFIMIVLVFYFLRDGDKIKAYAEKIANANGQLRLIKSVETMLKAILFGYFGTAILLGALGIVGFWLLGYEYAILLGLVVFLAALLPVLGMWLAYVPLTVYEYLQDDYVMMVSVLGFGLILQILGLWLMPKIAGKKARVHPGVMLLGFIGGPMFFGLPGFILGPLILGMLKAVLDSYEPLQANGNGDRHKFKYSNVEK
ncbi:MAG: AI-2E family transporter [archaeon]